MLWQRSELKRRARVCMHKFYWSAVLACLIFAVLQYFAGNTGMPVASQVDTVEQAVESGSAEGVVDASMNTIYSMAGVGGVSRAMSYGGGMAIIFGILILMIFLNFFIISPIQVGLHSFFYKNRFQKTSIGELAAPFNRQDFLPVVRTMFLKNLYITLWSFLFLIPGIIKTYEYCMVDFIIAENPTMPTREAIRLSREMTYGQKWNIFVLDLSFIGWNLLGGLTFGMSNIFFTSPYRMAVQAELYDTLKHSIRRESSQEYVF